MMMLREPAMNVVIWLLTCFGVFIPLALVVQIWVSGKIRILLQELCDAAIVLIRWGSMVYFVFWLVGLYTIDGDPEEWMNLRNRMSGPYAGYYWMFLMVYVVVPQLFWINSIYDSKAARLMSAVLILLVINLERIVILITSFHRDYVPSSWTESNLWIAMLSNPLLGLTHALKITAFVMLLFIIRHNRTQV